MAAKKYEYKGRRDEKVTRKKIKGENGKKMKH